MLFRPVDDDLEQQGDNASQAVVSNNQISETQNGGQIFHSIDNDFGNALNQASGLLVNDNASLVGDIDVNSIVPEEAKSPDLSELLNESGEIENNLLNDNPQVGLNSVDDGSAQFISDQKLDQINEGSGSEKNISRDNEVKDNIQSEEKNDGGTTLDLDISDEDRINIVSNIKGGVHSNLDLLVNKQRENIVAKYKIIHRIVFKRGLFSVFSLCGMLAGIVLQVDAGESHVYKVIKDEDINNSNLWDNNPEMVLGELDNKGSGIKLLVPYGSAKVDGNKIFSRSNLLSYNGIILPQVSYVNYQSDKFSLEDFNDQSSLRENLESILDFLVMNESIYKMTKDLPGPSDSQTLGQNPHGGLIDGFSLGCLSTHKLSNFLCDNILHIFYKYGKYYNLKDYGDELLSLMKTLKKQNENIEPICQMVNEYTWHSGIGYDDNLNLVMNYCSDEDKLYYKKMANFIEVEKSLNQPQISSKVFEDPDINAYKLISAWQSVYKILEGTSLNKNYILSYLKFVQELINKDKGTDKYIGQMYKDLLYIFNTDKLYSTLLSKGDLSSDIKSQMDQINNGNSLYGYKSLSELVSQGLVESGGLNIEVEVKTQSIDQIFAQYYSMNDHLRIKKAEIISDDKIGTQTEIFSDKILKVTGGETLKATVILYRKDNVLYVDSIKIASQQGLTDILNIRASEGNVTFYAMLAYIDEQIDLWYDREINDEKPKWSLCDELEGIQNIDIYSCDESSIVIYKGDIEYSFSLTNGVLDTFDISSKEISGIIRDKLSNTMMTKDNTPIIIKSILDFELKSEESFDDMTEKLQIVNQFRINLKLVPEITEIEGKTDEFLLKFSLGDIDLQANYNINTHLLTNISYVACDKTLLIRNLTIDVSVNNETQLKELLNNPRIFFTKANQAAYRKYLRMCNEDS